MKFCIFGAGAIGGYLAVELALSGQDVCVIARGEHRSIAAMAEEVGVEPSALVRNLRLLEARGLVASEGGRGRGGRQLAVTPQGADLIKQTIPAWRRAQADLAARLDGDPDETRQALVRLEHAALALERAER